MVLRSEKENTHLAGNLSLSQRSPPLLLLLLLFLSVSNGSDKLVHEPKQNLLPPSSSNFSRTSRPPSTHATTSYQKSRHHSSNQKTPSQPTSRSLSLPLSKKSPPPRFSFFPYIARGYTVRALLKEPPGIEGKRRKKMQPRWEKIYIDIYISL